MMPFASLLVAAAIAAGPAKVEVTSVTVEVFTATGLPDPPGTAPFPHLIVRAEGRAPLPSSQGVRLEAAAGDLARGDGFIELDLTADRSRFGVRDVVMPVRAAAVGLLPPGLKGVRVRGANGTVAEAGIESPAALKDNGK